MISEFMKRERAERIANSQFTLGAFVAVVSHHWDRRIVAKRAIAKVYATGNFVLASRNEGGPAETQQWRPDRSGTSARHAGPPTGYRASEHLEIWTPDIDAEIAERRSQRDRMDRGRAVLAKLQTERDRLDEHTLRALEAALGLSTAPPSEPEAD